MLTSQLRRSRLQKDHAKGKIVLVQMKGEEFKLFSKMAKENNQTLSEWIRSALTEAALTDEAFRSARAKRLTLCPPTQI
jgi:hypothetical protein